MAALDLFRGSKAASDIAKNFTDPYEEERKSQRELQLYGQKKAIDSKYKDSEISSLDKARENYYNAQANKLNTTVEGEYLTPSQKNQKNKLISSIYSQIESNKVKRDQIAQAQDAITRVPKGRLGSIEIGFLKQFSPEDPKLADWQKVKSVLTDSQLLFTARTKGAISDREMELFANAAANDDLASVSRMKPVMDRLSAFIDAEQNASVNSFREIYDEDPMQWQGMGNQIQQAAQNQSGGQMGSSYKTRSGVGYTIE